MLQTISSREQKEVTRNRNSCNIVSVLREQIDQDFWGLLSPKRDTVKLISGGADTRRLCKGRRKSSDEGTNATVCWALGSSLFANTHQHGCLSSGMKGQNV